MTREQVLYVWNMVGKDWPTGKKTFRARVDEPGFRPRIVVFTSKLEGKKLRIFGTHGGTYLVHEQEIQ